MRGKHDGRPVISLISKAAIVAGHPRAALASGRHKSLGRSPESRLPSEGVGAAFERRHASRRNSVPDVQDCRYEKLYWTSSTTDPKVLHRDKRSTGTDGIADGLVLSGA